jgi:type III secretion protein V
MSSPAHGPSALNTRQKLEVSLQLLAAQRDLLVVLLVVVVVALIAFPLPVFVIDVLIIANFALSLVVLIAVVRNPSPIEFSSFPSLLLFTTLLRLGLNIASTKLILITGHGPHIVEAFGTIVVGGNYVVGGIVFLILTVVQFIVIAKGAERAAEVSARFTLDAMPGKQMSIDADLRSGLISMLEARERRSTIELESKLHSGLDGAMKFVKGDSIAGLAIAAITIIGGIAIGAGMQGMSVGEAARRFALLTIGDSMVAQIPALLLSIAAGIMITQAGGSSKDGAGESGIGDLIVRQIGTHYKGLMITGLILTFGALLPGVPTVSTLFIAFLLLGPAFLLLKREGKVRESLTLPVQAFAKTGRRDAPPMVFSGPLVVALPLSITASRDLISRLHPIRMNIAFANMRFAFAGKTGLPFPGMTIVPDPSGGAPGEFTVNTLDVIRFRACIPTERTIVSCEADALDIPGLEPMAELAALAPRWRFMKSGEQVPAGCAPVQIEECLALAVLHVLERHSASLIGLSEAASMMRNAEVENPELVTQLTAALPISKVADVLRRLVDESVPLRDMRSIFDALNTAAAREKDPVLLTEQVRLALSAQSCQRVADEKGTVRAVVLSQASEARLRTALQQSRGNYQPFAEDEALRLIKQFRTHSAAAPKPPILAVQLEIRRFLRKLIEPHARDIMVMSFGELAEAREVVLLGELELGD